ncbi:MAG TPA: prenyltransferase/squalene oxidase repeat-containing protein [Candidatus Sumerlaeota bacterium]|nr:prenyltransferase/squalene oxidase repeat-containing protein [Candidatus Sumerlaeota bacterium]
MTTISLSLLDRAARARHYLDPDDRKAIAGFLLKQRNPDGGFRGRSTESDLYYAPFALGCLLALGENLPVEEIQHYLASFGDGEGLDLVHLGCLLRCRRILATPNLARQTALASRLGVLGHQAFARLVQSFRVHPLPGQEKIQTHLLTCRCPDGGYASNAQAAERGEDSIYTSFIALLIGEDLGIAPENPDAIAHCVRKHRAADGGYGNRPGAAEGTTTVTSAAGVILQAFNRKPDPAAPNIQNWLHDRYHPSGGFYANPRAPLPDLLSTASALFALRLIGAEVEFARTGTLDFVEMLWAESGGFCPHAADETPDCEYVWYALLTLGCLAK